MIRIQAKTVKKCLLLEMKNSVDAKETYTEGYTGKKNPLEHGMGLMNVRDAVKKYHGVIDIECKGGIFAVSVLLPLGSSVHDIK